METTLRNLATYINTDAARSPGDSGTTRGIGFSFYETPLSVISGNPASLRRQPVGQLRRTRLRASPRRSE